MLTRQSNSCPYTGRASVALPLLFVILVVGHRRVQQVPAAQLQWTQAIFTGSLAYSPTQSLIAVRGGFNEIILLQPDGTVVQTISTGQRIALPSPSLRMGSCWLPAVVNMMKAP